MFLEYIKSFHLQDCLNILSNEDLLGYYSINIDFLKLFETYPDVGDKVLCSPVKTLPACNEDIIKLQQTILEDDKFDSLICQLQFKYLKRNVHARFFGLPVCPELHRTIFPKNIDLGCFLKVSGTVVRVTQSKMLEYQRKYVCMKCKFENCVEADFESRYILKAPTKCGNTEMRCKCASFTQINLVSREHCRDYQEIKIQEQVNKLSIGTIPGSMWVVLEDDLVDCCKPGDDVIICGSVRRRWRPSVHNKKSEVEIVLQANYIEVSNSQKSEAIAMAPDVKDCFDQFWSKYEQCPLKGRDQILSAVCPQVYGLFLVKLAVLLTVITGSNHIAESKNSVEDKHAMHVRGQCHLLLVGDPGTGKSQLLKTGAELTPRSVFTSGAGSTRAGLTCAALREDGEWQLEAGALVLSDGGVCCIDEISHLRDHDRTAIHEAMEQQTISVAKAGIVCKLNTRCAVIAACNPKGHYQRDQPLSVNVSLGTPLLSRFDLIFILLDSKNSEWDKLVSTYILFGDLDVSDKKKWDIEKLQMYISLIGPRPTEITKSANMILQCYYMMQRKSEYRDPSRTTVRMLDSLIRLSQAHCRLMYRTTILPVDAITAISLIDLSMQDCTLDNTVDALHSTFQKYPDFQYLCTAKQLLTRLGLYEIWKEELLCYGKLLQVYHKTLEHHIDNNCDSLFARYDNVTDINIPLSSSIVTSSYFKKNQDDSNKNVTNEDVGEDVNKKDKVINDKLAATLKKHATLNKVDKKPPIPQKKKQIRKRKQVTTGVNDLIATNVKKKKDNASNSDSEGYITIDDKKRQENTKNYEVLVNSETEVLPNENIRMQKTLSKENSDNPKGKSLSQYTVSNKGKVILEKNPKCSVSEFKNRKTKIDFNLSTESDDEELNDSNENGKNTRETSLSQDGDKFLNKGQGTLDKKPKCNIIKNQKTSEFKKRNTKIDLNLSTVSVNEELNDKTENASTAIETKVDKNISNKTLRKLNQFIFKENSDFNRFYNENPMKNGENTRDKSLSQDNDIVSNKGEGTMDKKPKSNVNRSNFDKGNTKIDFNLSTESDDEGLYVEKQNGETETEMAANKKISNKTLNKLHQFRFKEKSELCGGGNGENKRDKALNQDGDEVSNKGDGISDEKPKSSVNTNEYKNRKTKIDFNLSTEIDNEEFNDKIENDGKETEMEVDENISNKTSKNLNQFIFKENSDLNRFYNEKPKNQFTRTETIKNIKSKLTKTESSSQISMFESSDCEIDLDI